MGLLIWGYLPVAFFIILGKVAENILSTNNNNNNKKEQRPKH